MLARGNRFIKRLKETKEEAQRKARSKVEPPFQIFEEALVAHQVRPKGCRACMGEYF